MDIGIFAKINKLRVHVSIKKCHVVGLKLRPEVILDKILYKVKPKAGL